MSTVVKRCITEVDSCNNWTDVMRTFPRLNALCRYASAYPIYLVMLLYSSFVFRLWRVLLLRSSPSIFERFVRPFQEPCLGLSHQLSQWGVQSWDDKQVTDPMGEHLQESRRLSLALEALGRGGYDSILHGWFSQMDVNDAEKKGELPDFGSFHDEGGARAQHFIAALF